jgi:hypothetical protein
LCQAKAVGEVTRRLNGTFLIPYHERVKLKREQARLAREQARRKAP